jgi:amino acid transporter
MSEKLHEDVKIGLATIWAIGVGSALGGDFFGWQFVLYGGFGGAFIGLMFAGVFYWLYASAITELAARFKTTGGSFDFVRFALGEEAAAAMAVLNLLKLVLANSALALAISSYLVQGGMPRYLSAVCWILTYGLFTLLDCVGVKQSANAQVLATVLCVVILAFYAISTLTEFRFHNIHEDGVIDDGTVGFFKGLPFSLQFFDGFEEVPLLMGYAIDPERTIPRAILASYISIASIGFMVLIAGAGSIPAGELLASDAPLMDGIDLVYGPENTFSNFIAYMIVVGLLVNFFAFVLFISQQVQAVSEAKFLPVMLAYRHPVHGAPIYASIAMSVVGVILSAAFALIFGEVEAQDTLVTAALMPAVLGYALILECIVKVRSVEKDLHCGKCNPRDLSRIGYDPGPLRFSFGLAGARLGQAMCVTFAFSLLVLAGSSKDFLYGLLVLALFSAILYAVMRFYIITEVGEFDDISNIRLLKTEGDADSDSDPVILRSKIDAQCYESFTPKATKSSVNSAL